MKEEKTKTEEPIETTDIKEFWIGFRNASYFVRYFLKRGFQHTYVLLKDGGKWVELNPRNHAMLSFVLPYPKSKNVPDEIKKEAGHRFLHIKVEQKIKHQPDLNIFKPINCVNIVKYIVGIKLRAHTPYQLYKKLTRMSNKAMKKKGILKVTIL